MASTFVHTRPPRWWYTVSFSWLSSTSVTPSRNVSLWSYMPPSPHVCTQREPTPVPSYSKYHARPLRHVSFTMSLPAYSYVITSPAALRWRVMLPSASYS